MAKSKEPVRIPLPPEDAIRLALKVKPTADMPRPGAQAMASKKINGKVTDPIAEKK